MLDQQMAGADLTGVWVAVVAQVFVPRKGLNFFFRQAGWSLPDRLLGFCVEEVWDLLRV